MTVKELNEAIVEADALQYKHWKANEYVQHRQYCEVRDALQREACKRAKSTNFEVQKELGIVGL